MKKYRLTKGDISQICLSLSMLIHAGIGSGDGLVLMAEDEVRPAQKNLLQCMAQQADAGGLLSDVFESSGCFPAYVSGLLRTGEETGRLEEALASLAEYYEQRMRQERQIRSALLYPAVLLLIMVAVIVVLLVKVLPMFDAVYAQLGSRLTGVAGSLLILGQILDRLMPVLCVLLTAVLAFLLCFSVIDGFRNKILSHWNRRFGDRGIAGALNTARIAQVLSMGTNSGLPMEESLQLAAALMEGIPRIKECCQNCSAELAAGAPAASCLQKYGVLPQAESRILEVGMQGGMGDRAMNEIARRLMEDSEDLLEAKVSQVEPALVMVTSLLVGLILLSVMLPLIHIMSAIG